MTDPEKQPRAGEDKEALAELESVKDLMNLASNSARIFKSYPSNNQLYLNFAQQLSEKFSMHLQRYGDLVLSIGKFEFVFDNKKSILKQIPRVILL